MGIVGVTLLLLACPFASSYKSAFGRILPKNPPPFEVVNEWKYLDFEYPSYERRQRAIANR